MHHYQMGHFDIIGRAYLAETSGAHKFAVAERAKKISNPILANVDATDLPMVEPCLEMQADHDASEMLIDAYSADEWPSLRARATAISAIMMLIELEDAKNRPDAEPSHPKAATRVFKLIGHLIQMPMINAMIKAQIAESKIVDPDDIPSDEEQAAYNQQVVIPCFLDAVNLARIAETDVIREDLGEPEDFFRDIQIARLGDPNAFNTLVTEGAVEWADLMMLNSKLMPGLDS